MTLGEAEGLQDQLQARVLELAPVIAGHDDMPDGATQLEEGLDQDVVLVAVRDDHVVDDVGQVRVGVARDRALLTVADERVGHDADVPGLQDEARMPVIADPDPIPVVPIAGRGRPFREEGAEERLLPRLDPHRLADGRVRARHASHADQLVDDLAAEGESVHGRTGRRVCEGC